MGHADAGGSPLLSRALTPPTPNRATHPRRGRGVICSGRCCRAVSSFLASHIHPLPLTYTPQAALPLSPLHHTHHARRHVPPGCGYAGRHLPVHAPVPAPCYQRGKLVLKEERAHLLVCEVRASNALSPIGSTPHCTAAAQKGDGRQAQVARRRQQQRQQPWPPYGL